jgi:hypothetical protein
MTHHDDHHHDRHHFRHMATPTTNNAMKTRNEGSISTTTVIAV